MSRKLIGDPKLVQKAKALRKRLVDGKPMSFAAIAKQLHLGSNKSAWVLVNDKPGMDRTPKGTRGAKVAAKTSRKMKATRKAVKRTTAKRQTRRAA